MEMNSRSFAQLASPHPALPPSLHPMRRRILSVFIRVHPWLMIFSCVQLVNQKAEIGQRPSSPRLPILITDRPRGNTATESWLPAVHLSLNRLVLEFLVTNTRRNKRISASAP